MPFYQKTDGVLYVKLKIIALVSSPKLLAHCLPLDDTVPSALASSVAGTMNSFPIWTSMNQKCPQEAVVISDAPYQIEQDNEHHNLRTKQKLHVFLTYFFFTF